MSKTILDLIKEVNKLPDIKQRGISAIVGATVADAATRPFHWVYNQQQLDNIIGDSKTPEFWPESKCPFYTLPTGYTSSYNDNAYVGLYALSSKKGIFDLNDLCMKVKEHFGPGTDYERGLSERDNRPVKGPWIHRAHTKFLVNLKTKPQPPYGDSYEVVDTDGFQLSIPYVAYFIANNNMWADVIKNVVNVLTTHQETVTTTHAAVLMLQGYIQGVEQPNEYMKAEFKKLYPNSLCHFEVTEQNQNVPFKEGVALLGKACYVPGSFKSAYLAMLQTDSFVDAVRLNIIAGGCNCSRANFIGSCFGAKYGINAIPLDWLNKTRNIENILKMCVELFSN